MSLPLMFASSEQRSAGLLRDASVENLYMMKEFYCVPMAYVC